MTTSCLLLINSIVTTQYLEDSWIDGLLPLLLFLTIFSGTYFYKILFLVKLTEDFLKKEEDKND